jgi:hypothetical protein
MIYAYTPHRQKTARAMRAAYCLAQHLDDILDGDRHIDDNPTAYVAGLVRQIETNDYDLDHPMAGIAQYVFTQAAAIQQSGDDFRADFLGLIKVLQTDNYRRCCRHLLSADDLLELHRQTFYYAINLALILAQADFRADALPGLVDAFSWCSPVRDLAQDLSRGLINIPREVVEATGRQADQLTDAALLTTPAVQTWLDAEYQRGLYALADAAAELRALHGRRGNLSGWAFFWLLKRYAAYYKRRQRPATPPAQRPASPGQG